MYNFERMERVRVLPQIEETSENDFIPTRSAFETPKEFQTIVHKTHKPKKKSITESNKKQVNKSANVDSFNLKKAKHEVVKLGMSGMNTEKKQEVKVQVAVKLGAKPPKNKNINYKQLLEEKKQEKLKAKSESKLHQTTIKKIKTKTNSASKPKAKGGLLESYGKVTGPVKIAKTKTKSKTK